MLAGDMVRFTGAYLRSIQAGPTDGMWKLIGRIVEVTTMGGQNYVYVDWGPAERAARVLLFASEFQLVLKSNLEKVRGSKCQTQQP